MTSSFFVTKKYSRANNYQYRKRKGRDATHSLSYRLVRASIQSLDKLSPAIAGRLAARIFCTPRGPRSIKTRDLHWLNVRRRDFYFHGKRLALYEWGNLRERPVVLLVHGWSGWGTQLKYFAEPLLHAGFSVVSFDHVAHGESEGSTTTLVEFIQVLLAIGANYPDLRGVIGHSMGGGAAAIACAWGLEAEKLVMFAAPTEYVRVSHFFAKHLGIGEKARAKMQAYLERKTGHSFASLGLTHIAPQIKQPVLAIYDENDPDILPENAEAIGRELPHAALRRTQGLGHHRILKDGKLIQDVTQFLLATVI